MNGPEFGSSPPLLEPNFSNRLPSSRTRFPQNVSSLTILVMGKGGVGKSSTVNSILGEREPLLSLISRDRDPDNLDPMSPILENPRPVTMSRSIPGFTLNVIDTPGLAEDGYVNDRTVEIIKRFLLNETVDILLYVERLDTYRVDNLDKQIAQTITDSFGKDLLEKSLGCPHACPALPSRCNGIRFVLQSFLK